MNDALNKLFIKGVTIIRTKKGAERVLNNLFQNKNRIVAWDTETIGVDLNKQNPSAGHGRAICLSAQAGPDLDFGNGPNLFIDNQMDSEDLIMQFKDYFEDPMFKKTWHNYGFDQHIIKNHGIDLKGFHSDTFHMARLADISRGPGEQSLSKLSETYLPIMNKLKHSFMTQQNVSQEYENKELSGMAKVGMNKLFSYNKRLKSGQLSKASQMPSIEELHTNPEFIDKWVKYSVLDAESTYWLREALIAQLVTSHTNVEDQSIRNQLDVQLKQWRPFAEALVSMERSGFFIDTEVLRAAEKKALIEIETLNKKSMDQVIDEIGEDGRYFNPMSNKQMQAFLQAPWNQAKINNVPITTADSVADEENKVTDSHKITAKSMQVNRVVNFKIMNPMYTVNAKDKTVNAGLKRILDFNIRGLNLPVLEKSTSGMPSVDTPTLKKLNNNWVKNKSRRVQHFYDPRLDQWPTERISKLQSFLEGIIEIKAIETLVNTFIVALQSAVDQNSRCHSSLNLLTETGRISSRKPNLMNQPSLDKDRYKIRSAFKAEKGNKLIICDYSQLELRILAHMTKCESMINAFKLGGDFHSRTAVNMYDYIKDDVDSGRVILETRVDSPKGIPLVKDKYASERKTAKLMNFSIAQGRTSWGFAHAWETSIQEADEALNRWFSDRPEVRKWQDKTKLIAMNTGKTQTILGRSRNLNKLLNSKEKNLVSHALRAAINTPIQGSAADVVIAAMVKIFNDKRLEELGWKMLLQIHDEIILEGPEESAQEAFGIVKTLMENSLDFKMLVDLEVDGKIANSWYEGK